GFRLGDCVQQGGGAALHRGHGVGQRGGAVAGCLLKLRQKALARGLDAFPRGGRLCFRQLVRRVAQRLGNRSQRLGHAVFQPIDARPLQAGADNGDQPVHPGGDRSGGQPVQQRREERPGGGDGEAAQRQRRLHGRGQRQRFVNGAVEGGGRGRLAVNEAEQGDQPAQPQRRQ